MTLHHSALSVLSLCLSVMALPVAGMELPAPVAAFAGVDIAGVRAGRYHPQHQVMWVTNDGIGIGEVAGEGIRLNPAAFTVAAWVMPSLQSGNHYRGIVFKGDRSERDEVDFKLDLYGMIPEFGYRVDGEWHGILRNGYAFAVPGQGQKAFAECPKLLPNRWNFLAVSFAKGAMRMYLNGELAFDALGPGQELQLSAAPMLLGGGETGGGRRSFPLNGLLDRVTLWDSALSAAQVEAFRLQTAAHYPQATVSVAWREEFPEYDPYFKRKLALVERYEAALPARAAGMASPEMTIAEHGGIPSIFRDGVAESAMCMMPAPSANEQGVFLASRDFAAAGVNYYSEIFWTWLKLGDSCSHWWTGYGQYEFERVAARLEKIVEANPKAAILVRVKLNVPEWWLAENPDERVVDEFGKQGEQPSMSSEKWLRDVSVMLADFVRYLEHSPLSPHIVGYVPAGGSTSEWFWWNFKDGLVDYSAINREAFRRFLRREYADDAALAQAWGDAELSLATADIPTPEQRRGAEDGFFRDPLRARQVYDYRRFMTKATTAAIRQVSKVVRENTVTRKLVGTFYGYSMTMSPGPALANLGFQGFQELLEDDNLDFFCAPTSYGFRRDGQSGDYAVGYLASIRLHNKVYYDEADMRTYLSRGNEAYRADSLQESLNTHWRSFGNALAHGVNIWWFLIAGNGTFHTDALMEQIASMSRLSREYHDVSRRSVAQVAVLCDEESMHFYSGKYGNCASVARVKTELANIGAPSDVYLLGDIGNERMPDYKLYIFLNAFYITPERREAIQRKLSRNHAAALWIYAPGYLSPTGASVATMAQLTGMTLRRVAEQPASQLVITQSEHPLARYLGKMRRGEQPFVQVVKRVLSMEAFAPAFFVDDPEADVIGELNGQGALAVKQCAWGTSIFSLNSLTPDLARGACEMLGIPVYMDSGDVFQANESFMMVHAVSDGEKRLRLPEARTVRNLNNDERFPATTEVRLQMKRGDTVIFQLEKN